MTTKRIYTYYDKLAVSRDASDDEIISAYEKVREKYIFLYTEDDNPNKPDNEKKQKGEKILAALAVAYENLIDPVKRTQHDTWIDEQDKNAISDLSKSVEKTISNFSDEIKHIGENAENKIHEISDGLKQIVKNTGDKIDSEDIKHKLKDIQSIISNNITEAKEKIKPNISKIEEDIKKTMHKMDSDSEVKIKIGEHINERESYDKEMNESDHEESHNSSTNYVEQKNKVNYFDKFFEFLVGAVVILGGLYFFLPILLPNDLVGKIKASKSVYQKPVEEANVSTENAEIESLKSTSKPDIAGLVHFLNDMHAQQAEAKETTDNVSTSHPYTAYLTCEMMGNHTSIMSCFLGSHVNTQLEITNGGDYQMLQGYELNKVGQEYSQDGLVILLNKNFSIRAQNANSDLILTLKIVESATGKQIYKRSASQWKSLAVENK